MAEVLAGINGDDSAPAVAGVAAAVAQVVRTEVRQLGLTGARGSADAAALLRALAEPDTLLAVLAADRPPQSTCWRVVRQSAKPVVVVPAAVQTPRPISRVLAPLDGTAEAAGAVAETLELFARAGVDLVVLHVFDDTTVPRFWDQPAHAQRAWEQEFMARYCTQPGARLELRSGTPGQRVIDFAAAEHVDLITLGWSQRLDLGRARIVRKTVADSGVPVMLVPVSTP